MTAAVLDRHDDYHRFSYCVDVAAAASALLLIRHRVGYIALTVLIGVQGIAAGFAPVEVRRLEDSDFSRTEDWHDYSKAQMQTGRSNMKLCLAGALVAAPLSLGLSMLAITGGMHIWGDVRFYRSIKKRMIRVLKKHEIDDKEKKVIAEELHKKLRKIKAKSLTKAAWKKLKTLPKLRKLTIDTLPKDLKLPQLNVLTTIVLRDPKEGWHHALVDCSWIKRIVIQGEVKPEHVQMILQGKHLRLCVIELEHADNMRRICGGSYIYVPSKNESCAKIRISRDIVKSW